MDVEPSMPLIVLYIVKVHSRPKFPPFGDGPEYEHIHLFQVKMCHFLYPQRQETQESSDFRIQPVNGLVLGPSSPETPWCFTLRFYLSNLGGSGEHVSMYVSHLPILSNVKLVLIIPTQLINPPLMSRGAVYSYGPAIAKDSRWWFPDPPLLASNAASWPCQHQGPTKILGVSTWHQQKR